VCSIIGYKGNAFAAPLIVESLRKMEYRGYDSVGIATLDNGNILVKKGVGNVAQVSNLPTQMLTLMGHARQKLQWFTME
jgi:glucosamine--fructose-6-phosphate aminotransferase (isomerizing)